MKAMNKVASHINEMQKLHEEYGAVFDQLINEQTADKKEVNTIMLNLFKVILHESNKLSSDLNECFIAGLIISIHLRWLTFRWGIFCYIRPWCGSTLHLLWSRAKRTLIWLLLVRVHVDFYYTRKQSLHFFIYVFLWSNVSIFTFSKVWAVFTWSIQQPQINPNIQNVILWIII